ncbi:MAG TPA: TetR/AcrR family transcriptional regulator [Solirubrobacterales bacterium]|nr:TetR/AcrR family transcriptional regulator [Solirubrobacterales bacterium]
MEALGPLREVRSWDQAVRRQDTEAALRAAIMATIGERGFAKATVKELAERTGLGGDRFHRRFHGKQAAFAWAYEEGAERLYGDLLDACQGAATWRAGFEAAVASLLGFVAAEPAVAKALLVEVRAARGDAWEKHQELTERLIDILDSARHEPGARPSATVTTSGFVLGAIEETLCIELAAGRGADVERLLPDLTHLAFLQLFGEGD